MKFFEVEIQQKLGLAILLRLKELGLEGNKTKFGNPRAGQPNWTGSKNKRADQTEQKMETYCCQLL